ncbi:ROK family protein [candidate division KSB1 bacterium]|nr:ROK family protein [candidate division KSB1 bacterium]
MGCYIGLDIGGTKLLVAAANPFGDIIKTVRQATPTGLDAGLSTLHEMIREVCDGQEILGMGAAIGGPLDYRSGIVSPLHQPEWRNVPLKEIMQSTWNCPFFVDVDTNAAALGEYVRGGVTCSKLLYMTISTGIGGGFVIDGQIYRGKNGAHPEIGHQSVFYRCKNPDAVMCECGIPDCLEALISGNGIRRIYGKPAERLNAEEWAEIAYNLGQGLRNLAALYTPDTIVLGGGVALGAGDKLLPEAVRVMKENLILTPAPDVRLSTLGYETALWGALVIAEKGI